LSERDVKHWSEVFAERIVSEKKEPFVIASGITTSGPTHAGTACEFLYPSALVKYLVDQGYRTEFVFNGDIMDAFDSVPEPLKSLTWLKDHLGKPLCEVPDPYECCASYGHHFLNEAAGIMKRLEIAPRILPADELVRQGRYDPYARLFRERLTEVKAIAKDVQVMSGLTGLPDWVDIVMPVCESCGRIATTVVKSFDGDRIQYADTKDVKYAKGCGYTGEMRLGDHRYKLFWRLDWPSRQDFLRVSSELAGVDHHTRGGSWDTAVAIHRKIFGKDPPVGGRYGFVLFHGKKYSKSKGVGISVQELLDLVPPELVKYVLFRSDIGENKELDPSGHKLMRLYEEFSHAADLHEARGAKSRAESKLALAYTLTTNRRRWRANFADVLLYYQVYHDWDKVGSLVSDVEGVRYLKPYVESWVSSGYLPEEYVFKFQPSRVGEHVDEILSFARDLTESMDATAVHNLVYAKAAEGGIDPSQLFRLLYTSLISKGSGPRFGKFVGALGVVRVKETLLSLYA